MPRLNNKYFLKTVGRAFLLDNLQQAKRGTLEPVSQTLERVLRKAAAQVTSDIEEAEARESERQTESQRSGVIDTEGWGT
jgi:hypothetical protein